MLTSIHLFSRPTRSFIRYETALVKIRNDLITTVDEGRVGAVVLLDLSAAFDKVDHQLLLEILLRRRFSSRLVCVISVRRIPGRSHQ